MKKIPFCRGSFLASAFQKADFPHLLNPQSQALPEIALVGRSNVGKSSLINHLLKNKTLAKTSSTPGKTQSINFFNVDDQLILVDLPGYGYAQVCKKIRKEWAPLIDTYLEERSQLKLILLLVDCRRDLNEEDLALIQWALFRSLPLVLIFTKADKLNKTEKLHHQKKLMQDDVRQAHLYYSTKDSTSRITLIETINRQIHLHGTH